MPYYLAHRVKNRLTNVCETLSLYGNKHHYVTVHLKALSIVQQHWEKSTTAQVSSNVAFPGCWHYKFKKILCSFLQQIPDASQSMIDFTFGTSS